MLPLLETSSDTTPAAVPPPRKFRPICGTLRGVAMLHLGTKIVTLETKNRDPKGRPIATAGHTAAQQKGIRYESKVQRHLGNLFPNNYTESPYIRFRDDLGDRGCQPDGLLRFPNHDVLIEVKVQHLPESWWQLTQLYRPLLEFWKPGRPVSVLEVCGSFDPAMPYPCKCELVTDLELWCSLPREELGVYVCKP
jgi:hypothetical protein